MEFVKEYKGVLGKCFCNKVIERFTKDNAKSKGMTQMGINEKVKITMDLHSDIWEGKSWEIVYSVLQDALHTKIITYYDDLNKKYFSTEENPPKFLPYPITKDSGFQIQHYAANIGKYVYHNDFLIDNNRGHRTLAYIFYLNDVEEGGETGFYDGSKIKAETGKLVFFPSLWTHLHRGNMPISNDKYIITGWIYSTF